jgi:hypothetical protein
MEIKYVKPLSKVGGISLTHLIVSAVPSALLKATLEGVAKHFNSRIYSL